MTTQARNRPPAQLRLFTTKELAELGNVTTRQIDHWCRTFPWLPRPRLRRREFGSGYVHRWMPDEAEQYVVVARLVRHGFNPRALERHPHRTRVAMLHALDRIVAAGR